jgi:hypothetical protein
MEDTEKARDIKDFAASIIKLHVVTQSFTTFLMVTKTMGGGAELLWKTLVFLCFYIVQLVNMLRMAIALRLGGGARHGHQFVIYGSAGHLKM